METKYCVDTIALRKAMAEAELNSIEALSKKSKVSRDTISKILVGEYLPSSGVIGKIAEALELTTEQIGAIFFKKKLA